MTNININNTSENKSDVVTTEKKIPFYDAPSTTVMKSYPPRTLDRRLQEDWTRDAGEDPRILMSLRVDFGPMG